MSRGLLLPQPHRSVFSPEAQPISRTPPQSLSKRQKEKIKKKSEGSEPQGAPPQPTTSYFKSATGGSEGKTRAQRLIPHLWWLPEAPSVFSITAQASTPPLPSWAGEGAAPSVLVDSKNPDSVELGQLGNEHTHQRHSVEDEMDLVVLGIEAGEEVPVGGG